VTDTASVTEATHRMTRWVDSLPLSAIVQDSTRLSLNHEYASAAPVRANVYILYLDRVMRKGNVDIIDATALPIPSVTSRAGRAQQVVPTSARDAAVLVDTLLTARASSYAG